MANLEDLGKKLGVDIKPSNKKIGKKRRSWLTSEQQKESTNGLQSGDKESTNKTDISEFESLTGIQKRIIEYMYQSCTGRSRITSKINIIELQESLKLGESTTKTSILRLKKKDYIAIANRKNGRGGWCQYELKKSIFNDASKLLQNNSLKETDNHSYIYNSNNNTTNINKYKNQSDSFQPDDADKDKIIADLQKQLELQKQQFSNQSQSTSSPSEQDRLTDHINKKLNDIETQVNTENAADTQDDQEAWANIDFSALADYGFKKSHIKQIINAKTSLTPQEVQESIEHYAWALENRREEMKGYAPNSNPLRGLMGVLKKGNAWVEGSYKSPEELALELQIKNKRIQLERQQAKKDELFNIEFEMWYTALTPKDIAKIEEAGELAKQMPPTAFKTKGDNAHYVKALKRYFKQHIYKG